MVADPAWAVIIPASPSWQSSTVSVWLEPFRATSSLDSGVTTAPLRSQVTSASGGDTSHRNTASSPSWTVRGVSSETSFTGRGSREWGQTVKVEGLPRLLYSSGSAPLFHYFLITYKVAVFEMPTLPLSPGVVPYFLSP